MKTSCSWTCEWKGVLEDPDAEPPEEAFAWTKSWKDAPEKPAYLKIGFEKGLPVSVDGERLSPAQLIARVGRVAWTID